MLKGIIFDMDGVLINSEPMHYKAYCLALEEYDISYPYEIYQKFIGTTNEKILIDIRSRNTLTCTNEAFLKKLSIYKDFLIEQDGFEEVKGVTELVRTLYEKGYQLAVASSSPYKYIIRVTKSLGIYDYFHKLISGEQVPNPKPAPDVFLKAAEALNLSPSECIIIEDSTNGVKAAKAAGICCIGFYNSDSGNQNLEEATLVVKSFENWDAEFVNSVYQGQTKN